MVLVLLLFLVIPMTIDAKFHWKKDKKHEQMDQVIDELKLAFPVQPTPFTTHAYSSSLILQCSSTTWSVYNLYHVPCKDEQHCQQYATNGCKYGFNPQEVAGVGQCGVTCELNQGSNKGDGYTWCLLGCHTSFSMQ